jgi:hypothetical protein
MKYYFLYPLALISLTSLASAANYSDYAEKSDRALDEKFAEKSAEVEAIADEREATTGTGTEATLDWLKYKTGAEASEQTSRATEVRRAENKEAVRAAMARQASLSSGSRDLTNMARAEARAEEQAARSAQLTGRTSTKEGFVELSTGDLRARMAGAKARMASGTANTITATQEYDPTAVMTADIDAQWGTTELSTDGVGGMVENGMLDEASELAAGGTVDMGGRLVKVDPNEALELGAETGDWDNSAKVKAYVNDIRTQPDIAAAMRMTIPKPDVYESWWSYSRDSRMNRSSAIGFLGYATVINRKAEDAAEEGGAIEEALLPGKIAKFWVPLRVYLNGKDVSFSNVANGLTIIPRTDITMEFKVYPKEQGCSIRINYTYVRDARRWRSRGRSGGYWDYYGDSTNNQLLWSSEKWVNAVVAGIEAHAVDAYGDGGTPETRRLRDEALAEVDDYDEQLAELYEEDRAIQRDMSERRRGLQNLSKEVYTTAQALKVGSELARESSRARRDGVAEAQVDLVAAKAALDELIENRCTTCEAELKAKKDAFYALANKSVISNSERNTKFNLRLQRIAIEDELAVEEAGIAAARLVYDEAKMKGLSARTTPKVFVSEDTLEGLDQQTPEYREYSVAIAAFRDAEEEFNSDLDEAAAERTRIAEDSAAISQIRREWAYTANRYTVGSNATAASTAETEAYMASGEVTWESTSGSDVGDSDIEFMGGAVKVDTDVSVFDYDTDTGGIDVNNVVIGAPTPSPIID